MGFDRDPAVMEALAQRLEAQAVTHLAGRSACCSA
jgi:hypothetical protein